MQWYELASNPRSVSSIYNVVPSLQKRRLREVRLEYDGRITFIIDMPFPEPIPLRWKQRGYNVLYLQLDFWGIEAIEIMHWSTDNIVDIHIERASNDQIEVQALSTSCHIRLSAQDIILALYKEVQVAVEKR